MLNSTNIRKELQVNFLNLYNYLSIYGVDRFNTKEELFIILFIEEILTNNCYYNILSECDLVLIERVLTNIKHNNESFKYCRFNIDDYKNLGGKQNIRTFQIIK